MRAATAAAAPTGTHRPPAPTAPAPHHRARPRTATAPGQPVSPVLARLGGLPARAVPAPGEDLVAALEEVLASERSLEAQADPLLELLYDAVPLLPAAQRRGALRAKRAVFHGRPCALEAATLSVLPDPLPAAVRAWDEAVETRRRAGEVLEAAVEADLRASGALLSAGLDDEDYLGALAVAAPGLVAAVERRGARVEDPRMVRTLYSFATRAALKASPFASLTTVSEAGRPARGRRRATVAAHLAHGMLLALARQLDPDSGVELQAVPVRRAQDPHSPQGLALVAEHDYAEGMVFRTEEVLPERWTRAAHAALGADPVPVGRAMRLVGGPDPRRRLARLLASGAVRVVVPWTRGESPFPALEAVMSERQRRAWGPDRDRLSEAATAVAGAGAVRRAELLIGVREVAERVFPDGELGQRPGGLLYEDCEAAAEAPDPLALPAVSQDVATLCEIVGPWVTRSRMYDLMVERFVARYGSGGVCTEPLGFLMSLAHAPDGDMEMLRAAGADYAAGPDPDRAALPGGPSAAPRHLGAYIQPVASSWEDYAAGRGLTVVNAFTTGNGALQARFHRLLGRGYRERLARGLRSAWGLDRVLEIEVSAECNTGQAVCSGVLPALGLPGEPASPGAVPLETLRIVHDPVDSTLAVVDAHGPVGLAYLGLTPQHLLGGYLSWLVLLSDPWVRLPPASDHWTSRRRGAGGPMPDEPVHEPRSVSGRLVTRRESWTFPAQDLAGVLEEDLALSLVQVARLRERWGLPAEVFVHQHMSTPGATYDEHKPRYVDLRSPVSLLALRGWIDPRARHLSVVEALPARRELLGRTAQGQETVIEYLLALQWPKVVGGRS